MNFSHAAATRLLISERGGPGEGLRPGAAGPGLHLRRWQGAGAAGRGRAGSSLTRGPVARWLRPGGRCTSSSASRNGRAPALLQARGTIVPRGGAALRPPEAALPGGAAVPVPPQQAPRLGHGDARYKAAAGRGRPALTAPSAYRRAAAAGRCQWRGRAASRPAPPPPGGRRRLAAGGAAEGGGAGAVPVPAAPGALGDTWRSRRHLELRRPEVCAGAGQPRRAAGDGQPAGPALPAGLPRPPHSPAGHGRPQPRAGALTTEPRSRAGLASIKVGIGNRLMDCIPCAFVPALWGQGCYRSKLVSQGVQVLVSPPCRGSGHGWPTATESTPPWRSSSCAASSCTSSPRARCFVLPSKSCRSHAGDVFGVLGNPCLAPANHPQSKFSTSGDDKPALHVGPSSSKHQALSNGKFG